MRRRISYAWALYADPRIRLTDTEAAGLEYAQQLADDAQRRIGQLLQHQEIWPPPLTQQDVADGAGVSIATVSRSIALARRALYGEISDSGIRHRRRRQRQRAIRPARTCANKGCTSQLPQDASGARQYCDDHRTPGARVARHRQRKGEP